MNCKTRIVALTGGIGAGKSYVCQLLQDYGIEVYDCDAAAKRLMRTSTPLQKALQQLVGDNVYRDGILQKPVLAQFLLASNRNQKAVNDIIHPAVAADFMQSGYQWLESAIYFDSGFDKRVHADKVVCVTAPTEVRLRRIMERDGISSEKAQEWIDCQLPQAEVVSRSDYEIKNDGLSSVRQQIEHIIHQLKVCDQRLQTENK